MDISALKKSSVLMGMFYVGTILLEALVLSLMKR